MHEHQRLHANTEGYETGSLQSRVIGLKAEREHEVIGVAASETCTLR